MRNDYADSVENAFEVHIDSEIRFVERNRPQRTAGAADTGVVAKQVNVAERRYNGIDDFLIRLTVRNVELKSRDAVTFGFEFRDGFVNRGLTHVDNGDIHALLRGGSRDTEPDSACSARDKRGFAF